MGSRCIGCRTCIESCPERALSLTDEGMQIKRERCTNCGICSDGCPSTAMELLGTKWHLDDLVKEVEKDRIYFEKSGGGITASGGEPVVQADFVSAFFKRMKEMGIHTALDTCGFYSGKALDRILPYSDMVLYDVKEIDPVKHNDFTGNSNELIFNTLIHIYDYMKTHDTPSDLWIRTPIIPGATEREENITGIGTFIATHLGDGVAKWELCSFNNLCRDKYLRLGLAWGFEESPLLTKGRMAELTEIARGTGVNPDIVSWSGPTKIEEPDTEKGKRKMEPKITKNYIAAI
jgi:pyruvate formate lyase activating enzyme